MAGLKSERHSLQGIRVLKFYAWETIFHEKVAATRKNEMGLTRKLAYMKSINMLILLSTPVFVCAGNDE